MVPDTSTQTLSKCWMPFPITSWGLWGSGYLRGVAAPRLSGRRTWAQALSLTGVVWGWQRGQARVPCPTTQSWFLLQNTTAALHWPAPCPHIPSHPTHHPGTLLRAGTSCQPSATPGPPSSSTEPARSMASPCGPSVSTWATRTSTLCTTWCGYVWPSAPVVSQLRDSSAFPAPSLPTLPSGVMLRLRARTENCSLPGAARGGRGSRQ